nr:MAG TPA: Neck appendage protein [Caudoviricetes sp.]
MPLNAAYADEIVQEDNSTYQLSFRFPTSDSLWEQLKEEAFLTADDLHGEQDFVIFEVEKKHGYIQVYANQVFTLLNNYVVNPISLDRQTGSTALSRFAGSITRDNPFSFFSDIEDRHTFNIGSKNAMEAFAKDKHSIIGQWGGDLVRHGYQVRLLKNGGSENESLFMYKKNLSSYQHKTSTKSLKTRITFIATVKGEGEKAPDRTFTVTIDSPLINKYSQIYEDVIEVNDQDVKDEASLRKYGEQYYRTSLCDMMEDSLEIEVVGQSDVPVQMYDIVSLFHEVYNLDVRKKITKYIYSPMAKKLKSIGFGQFQSGLANAIGNAVSDAVKGEAQQLQSDFERQLARELKNADLAFERHKEELVNQFTDGLNATRARAEEVKQELSDTIDQRFNSFNNGPLQEAKRRAEEALRNAGASTLLAQEAKRIGLDSVAKLEEFKRQATSAQTALSGDLDVLKRTVTSEVNQASEYRRTTTEALSRMTGQMDGFATKSEVRQDVTGLTETFAKLKTDTNNLISGAKNEITLAKTEFKKTADGLSAKMSAVESYVGQDGQRQEVLQRYAREESARQATAVRELVTRDYVGKASHQEDVRAIERKFEAITNPQNGSIATQIAKYKIAVDGRLTEITSMISGKANQADFQRVQETSKLYERIIGSNENDISNKVARMALTNQLFQVEVSKYSSQGGPNLIKNSGNPQDSKNWGYWEIGQNPAIRVGTHDFFFKNKRNLFYVNNKTRETVPTSTIRFSLKRNTSYTVALTAFNTWNMKGATIYFLGRKSGENQSFSKVITLVENVKFSSDEAVRKNYTFSSGECDEGFIRIDNNGTNDNQEAILLFGDVDVYEGTVTRPWQPSPEDDNEAIRTVQNQLAGSWAVQNLTSAGSIVSQINATNNQILIEAEKIRLKGKTLLDELTAIQGYFKRLFVGEGNFAKLNAEIIGSRTITADKLIMDSAMARLFVSSDIFTDTLAAKTAFINKLRSVVVSATLLEGYKGKIGGFQIGTHDKDPSTYWLTGQNQFKVGMGSGNGRWGQTALWVNWGNDWEKPGDTAWYVKNSGEMYCYNQAHFWNTPVVHGNLKVSGNIYYITDDNTKEGGYWIHSPSFKRIQESSGYIYLYRFDNSYSWIPVNKEISDRRYKHNIEDSKVSALEVINRLKTYSYRKEYDGKIEDISCGIMAQDVQKYAPEAFFENPDGAYSYNTFALVPYLIKAIQELNQKIERLETTT